MRLGIVVSLFFYVEHMCSDQNYGPFKALVTKFDVCNGPKIKNCTVLTATVIKEAKLSVNVKVTENCYPSKGKVVVLSNDKELMRLQMNKPCDHLFLRPLFENLFRITKNCMILKGDYMCKIDMEEMTASYFGGKFFYGNLTFKSILYGNNCNFSCTILHITLSPKN